jgi:hypothetical protein
MGLFDNLKSAKISSRNDDGNGLYWQRLDKISVEKDISNTKERFQILKTNINVLEGNKAVGEQVSHAVFPDRDPKFNYFEKDVKAFLRAVFGLSDEQTNDMRKAESVKKFLTAAKVTARQVKLEESDRQLNETEIKMLDDVQTLTGVLQNLKTLNEAVRGSILETKITSKPNPKDASKPYLTVRYTRAVQPDEIKTLPPERLKQFGL